MADAEPGSEGGSERGGGGGRAPPGQGGSAARVAPLNPEQLRRVLEQVTRAQPPPPFVLRNAAQQAALQRAPDAAPPRPPRMLPPQQLEAIRVKVTSEDIRGQERPTPPLATIRPRTAGQSPMPGNQPGPLGLRVQPAAFGEPLPAKRVKAAPAPSSLGATLTPLPVSLVTPAASSSVYSSLPGWQTEQDKKPKKSLKVKTRSGRISRPPKHKAKDFKFIKTEDLADGRPSDSDDYAELSAEDEEEPQDPRALFAAASCALRPRAFRCQACDKAYIGQGGLARHWRLNPGHSQLLPTVLPKNTTTGGMASPEPSTLEPSIPEMSTPTVPHQDRAEAAHGGPQNGQRADVEEAVVLEPENGRHPALGFQCGDVKGPAEGPRTCRNRTRLQELLQQCGPEDLVDLALPRLAQVVSVYEFLLAKAEKSTTQPYLPAVYKEFEELHSRVQSLCQEHLGRTDPASLEPLGVGNPQVAVSLGIPEEFLRKTGALTDHTAVQHPGMDRTGQRPKDAGGWHGASEAAQEVPTARRPWRVALPTGGPEHPAVHGRGQEMPGPCAPTASEGFAPPASGTTTTHSEGNHRMTVSVDDRSVSHAGLQLKAPASSEARRGSASPAVLCGDSHGSALCAQPGEPRENVPDARPGQGSWGVCSSLSPAGGATDMEPGNPDARPMALPPKEVLPMDIVPLGCACRTGPDQSPLTKGSHTGDLKQLVWGMEIHVGQRDLKHMVVAGDATTFEITNGCPEVLSQGQEHIFIPTSSGLLLSHAGTIVSQEEDTVTVNSTGGHPEGIPP